MLSAVPSSRRRSAVSARTTSAAPATSRAVLQRIPLALIDVPPARIRRELGGVEDLAYSVGSFGLLHPVQVYRVRTRYRLIAGERRLQAARMLGWTEIDAMVREPSDNHLLLELVENTQRKWLTDVEEADALIRLVREMGHEAKEVAAEAGRSEAYVSKRIRVFEDPCLRDAVEREQLSVSVAEEFLALRAEDRPALVAQAVEGSWDGRRAREAVRLQLAPPPPVAYSSPVLSEPVQLTHHSETPHVVPGMQRPSDLGRQARALTDLLKHVRPYELTQADERALAELMQTLLRLARAHGGPGRAGVVFPSLAEAQRSARRR